MFDLGILDRFARADLWIDKLQLSEFEGIASKYFYARANVGKKVKDCPSDVHGAGIHSDASVALRMAISELIERLAFFRAAKNHPDKIAYQLDPSTTGMAALPSDMAAEDLLRDYALMEAVERWAMFEWIAGRLSLTKVEGKRDFVERQKNYVSSILLRDGSTAYYTLSYKTLDKGCVWGQGAARTLEKALHSSGKELWNHERKASRLLNGLELLSGDPLEKRCFSFATRPHLLLRFKNLLDKAEKQKAEPLCAPAIKFENEVDGFYNPELRVYRVVLERSPSIAHAKDEDPVI